MRAGADPEPEIDPSGGSRRVRWADATRFQLGLSPFLILPLWLFPQITDPTREGRFLYFQFVVALVLFLELFPSRQRYRWQWKLIHLPLTGLALLFLVHLAADPYLPGAFGPKFEGGIWVHHRYALRYVMRYGAFLVWVALIVSGRFGRRFPEKALDLCMVVSVPVAIYGILQHFGIEFLEWGGEFEERLRVISTLGNPLFLADYLAVGVVLLAGNFFRSRGRVTRVASVPALAILGFGIYATESRGAVLALLFGAAAAIMIPVAQSIRGKRRIRILARGAPVVLVVVLCVLLALQLPALEPWLGRFRDAFSLSDFSLLSRLVLWQVTLRQWSVSPWIGVGMEQFRLRHIPTLREVLTDIPGAAALFRTSKVVAANEAHGDYFQVLAEWGIVGLGLLLLLLLVGLVQSGAMVMGRGEGRWTAARKTAGVLFIVQVVLWVEMLYGFQLRLPSQLLLISSMVAFSECLWKRTRGMPPPVPRSGQGWAAVARRVALAGLGLAVAAYSLMVYRGEVCGGTARAMLTSGRLARGRELAFTAYRLLPEGGDFAFLGAISLWEQNEDPDRVLGLFDRALLTSTNTKVPIAKGLLLMQTRRQQEAYRVLQDFAALRAPLEGLHQARGMVEFLNRDYERAIRELETEVRLYPKNYEAYVYLALSYNTLGKSGLAIETLEQALRVKPRGLEAHIQLGEIHLQKRAYEEARREFEEAIAIARAIGDFRTAEQLSIRIRQIRLEREPP